MSKKGVNNKICLNYRESGKSKANELMTRSVGINKNNFLNKPFLGTKDN